MKWLLSMSSYVFAIWPTKSLYNVVRPIQNKVEVAQTARYVHGQLNETTRLVQIVVLTVFPHVDLFG